VPSTIVRTNTLAAPSGSTQCFSLPTGCVVEYRLGGEPSLPASYILGCSRPSELGAAETDPAAIDSTRERKSNAKG
jgi:hypothetical protein